MKAGGRTKTGRAANGDVSTAACARAPRRSDEC
jgi:hypothetical protein